jgi:hypothetical protein
MIALRSATFICGVVEPRLNRRTFYVRAIRSHTRMDEAYTWLALIPNDRK